MIAEYDPRNCERCGEPIPNGQEKEHGKYVFLCLACWRKFTNREVPKTYKRNPYVEPL